MALRTSREKNSFIEPSWKNSYFHETFTPARLGSYLWRLSRYVLYKGLLPTGTNTKSVCQTHKRGSLKHKDYRQDDRNNETHPTYKLWSIYS